MKHCWPLQLLRELPPMKILMLAGLLLFAVAAHADSVPMACGSFGLATGACDTFTVPGTAQFNLPASLDLTGFDLSTGLHFISVPVYALNGDSLGSWMVDVFPLTDQIDLSLAGSPLSPIDLVSNTALLSGPVNAESWTLGNHVNGQTLSFTVTTAPEPSELAMLLFGLPLLGIARKLW